MFNVDESMSVEDADGASGQREHHKEQTFEQEYKEMIDRSGLEWNDYRLT